MGPYNLTYSYRQSGVPVSLLFSPEISQLNPKKPYSYELLLHPT